MTASSTKPRYPAVVFHRLKRYPILHCQNPECGRQLTPRYTLYQGKHHKLESVATFKTRKFCDMTCAGRVRALKLAEERNERIQKAMEQTAKRTEVGERQKRRKTRPPEAPVQNETPIPAFFSLRQELANRGITTVEQVEATTDEQLLELPRVSKAKLKQLRLKVEELRRAVLRNPPTLVDASYGGPPAPEEVAEDLEPEPDMVAEKPSKLEPGEPDPETWRPGELKTGDLFASKIPESRKPRIGQAVRPVKLPSKEPFKAPPVPPPSLQAKLPDPRPQATPFTVTEGEVIERDDFGTCPNEGCGKRLNAFGRCGACEQRKHWLKGQRAKVGAA